MIDLIYYNQKGEVKSIEMLPLKEDESTYYCTPQENYFIKGFTINGFYLSKEIIFEILKNDLTSLENHFLNIGYGFFPELTGYMFRNENQIYLLNDLLKRLEPFNIFPKPKSPKYL